MTLLYEGAQYMGVYEGGTATGTIINTRTTQFVYDKGMAINTTVIGSDDEGTIFSFGSRGPGILDSRQVVFSGGTAINTTIQYRGWQWLYAGGRASGVTVEPRGTLYIQNGAILAGRIRIQDGGLMELDNSGGGSPIDLEKDATLELDTTSELSIKNDFTGEGKIIKTGDGTATLEGSWICTGGMEVRGGTLTPHLADNTYIGPLTVADGATCSIPGGSMHITVTSLCGGGEVTVQSLLVNAGGDFSGIVNVDGLALEGGVWDIAGDKAGTPTVNGSVRFGSSAEKSVTWRLTKGDRIVINGDNNRNFYVNLTVADPSRWIDNEPVEIFSFSGNGSLPTKYSEKHDDNTVGETFTVTTPNGSTYTFNARAGEEENSKKLYLTLVSKTVRQSGGGDSGGGGSSGGTVLSNVVTPLEVYTKIISDDKGTERKIIAEKQPDEITFAFLLPAGTDLTKLPVYFSLPDGATVDPKSGTERDFTTGPLSYTVKAENGVTTGNYFVTAKLEAAYPAPVERACFVTDPALCNIVYDENADGSFAAVLSIPYLPGMDGKNITTLKTTLTGLDLLAPFTCAWNNANVKSACLQITLKLAGLEALKSGRLEKIDYWLTGDGTNYVQTYTPPLDLSKVPLTAPSTPEPNSNHKGGGGGGCNSAGTAALTLLLAFKRRRMKK